MCGCPICGCATYGALGHRPENCINALKGELRAAREGREMVRTSLTADVEWLLPFAAKARRETTTETRTALREEQR